MPPLGLSNKAISDGVSYDKRGICLFDRLSPFEAHPALDGSRPRRRPFEGELASITLWPEIEKVFGHGYEVSHYMLHG